MKIYLIRHGETEWNTKRLLQGGTDIPLNEKGVMLAQMTAEGLKDVPFDCVYTSPLQRAKRTAELIIAGRNIPMVEELRLREIGFGPYEGLCCAKEGYNIPDPAFMNFFKKPEEYQAPEGAETIVSLLQRTKEFMEELAENPKLQDKTILLSSHGAAGKAIISGIRKTALSEFWGEGVQKNCAVTLIEGGKDGLHVIRENVIYYEEG